MGLFDIFRPDNTDSRLAYLRQLIRVAKADGHMDAGEYRFIKEVAARLETTDEELEELNKDPKKSSSLGLQTTEERFQFIWDLGLGYDCRSIGGP